MLFQMSQQTLRFNTFLPNSRRNLKVKTRGHPLQFGSYSPDRTVSLPRTLQSRSSWSKSPNITWNDLYSVAFHVAIIEWTSAGFLAFCVRQSVARNVYHPKVSWMINFFPIRLERNFCDVIEIGWEIPRKYLRYSKRWPSQYSNLISHEYNYGLLPQRKLVLNTG